MNPTLALLHKLSWQAEKLHRRRGHFRTVLWLTERADGKLELTEERCDDAPNAATDDEVLTMLAADVAADFAYDGVVAFAVAYAAKAHMTVNVLLVEPQTRTADVVAIEAHAAGEHLVAYRSIEGGSPPRLGPLSTPASASASRYATVLAA